MMMMFVLMRMFLGLRTVRCECDAGAGRARRAFGAGFLSLGV